MSVTRQCLVLGVLIALAAFLHLYHENAHSADYGPWEGIELLELEGWTTFCLQASASLLSASGVVVALLCSERSLSRFRLRTGLLFSTALVLAAAILLQVIERTFEDQTIQTTAQWYAGVSCVWIDAFAVLWATGLGGWEFHNIEWLEEMLLRDAAKK